jgi:hypothetical protein
MTDYLKLDSTKVTYGEYWRWKPGATFLILAISKLLGMHFPANLLVPARATVIPIDPMTQPRDLVAMLELPMRACQEKGFEASLYYTVPMLGNVVGMGAAMLRRDGRTVALVLAGQSRNGVNREVHLGLMTRLRNGRILGTGDKGSLFRPASIMESVRLPGKSYAQLLDAHDARVSARRVDVAAPGDIQELIRQIEQVQIDENVARGVYVPATPADIAKATQLRGPQG